MRIRFFIAVGCALGAVVLAPSAAAAQSSDGAQVSNQDQCDTTDYGTFCVHDHIVSTFTAMPSGGFSLVANDWYAVSFDGANGACDFQQSGRDELHALVGASVNVSHVLSRTEFRLPNYCQFEAGSILVCVSEMHFHQVNGVPQFSRTRTECTEETAAAGV